MQVINKVLIIPAFPAMGKTYFTAKNDKYTKQILDSDSSLFSWKYNEYGEGRTRNKDFPKNYLNYIAYMYNELGKYPEMEIKGLSGVSGIIFTSTHPNVLEGLNEYKLPFIAVVPNAKDVLLKRLKARNDPMEKMIDENFDKFVNDVDWNSSRVIRSNLTISELIAKGKIHN